MSTPRNHHYVSQVLSRKFFDGNGKLYLYDKIKDEFKTVSSAKHLFSQRDLNSIRSEDGKIDHSSVEDTLNRYFETGFNDHYNRVVEAAQSNQPIGQEFPNSDELMESLEYMIGMGIIGGMRTSQSMAEAEAVIFGSLFEIAQHATEELKASIYSSYQNVAGLTNKLPVDFKKISDGVLKIMGDKVFSLHTAPANTFFLLPDCSSLVSRAKLGEDIVVDGEVYYNPQRPIASVTMPINSKMIIGTNAQKIMPYMKNGFYKLTEEGMNIMNDQNSQKD